MFLTKIDEYNNLKPKDTIKLECDYCKRIYHKTKRQWYCQSHITGVGVNFQAKTFCSKECVDTSRITKINLKCSECNKEFDKLLSQVKKSDNHFCTRSCAAKFNNKAHPKRHADEIYCKGGCGKNLGKFWIEKRQYCGDCLTVLNNRKSIVKKNLGDRTFEEYLSDYKFRDYANKYTAIRQHGKKIIVRSGIPKCCKNCSYDKHVEVCHIKGIPEFDKSALISEINSLDNLIYLCPNCHWEYDHNILKI